MARTFAIELRGSTTAALHATLGYQVEFYKPGEAKPFETRVGTMSYSGGDEPRTRLDISVTEPASSAQTELDEIGNKLGDPKLTDAQRDALMERMGVVQQRMMDEIMKAGADPAAANKKVDDFGCHIPAGVSGRRRCREGHDRLR